MQEDIEQGFTTPSEVEMAELNEQLASISSLEDVIRILGEPDERYQLVEDDLDRKRRYGIKDVVQALRYTSLAKTLVLTVQKNEDGEITVIFEGKPKH